MSFIRLFAPDTDVPVTSGAVCRSSVKSRLKSGSLWIELSLTVCAAPTCDCASTGLCAFTTTSASFAVSGESTSESEYRWPSESMIPSRAAKSPVARASTRYGPPGDRCSAANRPPASLRSSRCAPVRLLTMVTSAATGAPALSVTRVVPSMAASVTPWAAVVDAPTIASAEARQAIR